MKLWHNEKHAEQLTNLMDVGLVTDFLSSSPPEMRYRVHSLTFDKFSPYFKASTVQRAIRNGHVDIELWVWVNPLTKVTDSSSGFPTTDYQYNGKTQSWVLDLDEIEDVYSIANLRSTMRARGVPLPYYISQTGPNCFHCMYFGHYGDWSERKRRWIMERWAGITGELEKDQWCKLVIASGVDIQYSISQHFGKHAFRVPGTINKNHPINGGFWRCLGWRNPDYNTAHERYLAEVGVPRPENVPDENVEAIATPTHRPDFTVYIQPVLELLEETFPKGFEVIKTGELAKMIANQANLLMKNTYRIHQVSWAKELCCSQPDISRLVKKLISMGILVKVSDSYSQGSYSKTYGAGPLLKPALGWLGMPLKTPDWVRWDDGTSNQRLLYDVRYFYSLGMPDHKILEQLQTRQAHRPLRKQRPAKELANCLRIYKNFLKKHKVEKTMPKVYEMDIII